jgi:hypothetical protein
MLSYPKDFSYSDAKRILEYYGYRESNSGKTSGSRVRFGRATGDNDITLHKPHNKGQCLKAYQIGCIIEKLKEDDLV